MHEVPQGTCDEHYNAVGRAVCKQALAIWCGVVNRGFSGWNYLTNLLLCVHHSQNSNLAMDPFNLVTWWGEGCAACADNSDVTLSQTCSTCVQVRCKLRYTRNGQMPF
jgi:hypothetical protein